MISVEHLMEIQERLHSGDNIDDVFNDVYELGRADAIYNVISWFQKEFERQNDPNSKFVPSCVIKENIYDVLEQLKEQTDGMG